MDSNEVIAKQWINEIWIRGNLSLLDELLGQKYRHHTRSVDLPGDTDIDYIKQLSIYLRRVILNRSIEIEDLLSVKDRVMIRWSMKGNDADGTAISVDGIALLKISNYRITDSWIFSNCTL